MDLNDLCNGSSCKINSVANKYLNYEHFFNEIHFYDNEKKAMSLKWNNKQKRNAMQIRKKFMFIIVC